MNEFRLHEKKGAKEEEKALEPSETQIWRAAYFIDELLQGIHPLSTTSNIPDPETANKVLKFPLLQIDI